MKTITLTLAWVTCFTLLHAQQTTEQPSRSIVKLSPQHFFNQQLKAGLERFNKSYTRSLVLYVNTAVGDKDSYGYNNYTGLGVNFNTGHT